MTDYTITKTENSTTINVPIGRKYKNRLNGTTYKNSSEGVKMLMDGQNWRRVGSAYLESILLGGDITETSSMTLNFKTQAGVTVPVEASTKPSELLNNLDEQVSLNDFYIDYLSTVGARVHLADYINTVLVDIYENQEVLSELIEETPETPEPTTPDTPTPTEPSTPEGQEEVIPLVIADILNSKIECSSIYVGDGILRSFTPKITFYDTTGTPLTMNSNGLFNITQITINETDLSPLTQTQYNSTPCYITGMATIPNNGVEVPSGALPFTITVQHVPSEKTFTLRGTVDPDTKEIVRTDGHTNGGGAVVSSDKCIHLPSGNIYLQINELAFVDGWIGYTIHYDNGTSYELIDGMIQRRDSSYKFYWVEDTTTPAAATYETPYVSFDEIIINETTIPVSSYTSYDNTSQQFLVYVDFRQYVELHNDVRLKVSVQYPDSEEIEILYF